ncbi:hypothetical protein BDY19DRAFT_880298 [Irpex rosettiformis]|uniref:Uncharacterized protein n=1 Tax=Irpex rosettiformis TaxID=378272 RepID=A0ACB8UL81_9APHY|nr:hypothetical protein BDY19DRAFT_880298 [Irpex rosettiformis]
MSSSTPSLNRKGSLRDYFPSLPLRSKLPSIRSRKSTASLNSLFSSYAPYVVHQQSMTPIILRDADATNKLLECILESPGGRKTLARLSRTCKAFKEPALDMLWRDLDSFVPLVSVFPNILMKRSRKPSMGLAKEPEADQWEKVLGYAERVRSITYVQAFNNVSPDIFPILAACPREYLLPNLKALTWKAENLQGLMYCRPYLTTKLESFTLEMGARAPKINDFLDEVMSKTKLTSFSFTLHSNIPENFVEKVHAQTRLEKLALMLPGILTAKIGKWASTLPLLKTIQLDLTNASSRAVENFFNDISPGSGYSTPSSVSGTDSGVFSGEDDIDFSEFRKSAARLTSDGPRLRPFAQLTQVNLTGEAGNIATFLRHVTSPLTLLELAIEDPPLPHEWRELCLQVSDGFGLTLQTLRIMPTSTARFAELVRSTSRGGDVQLRHLTLEHLGPMTRLQRFEIELPESAIFHNVDVAHLARACPNLEIARLCGQARFPPSFGPPYLTLEGIIPLTSQCKRLHTLAVVVNALDGRDEIYKELKLSSRALTRLNVGHSWCKNPLETAILISHIAPHLDSLKWFSPAIRAGSVDSHAAAWRKVQEFLPPMQRMRLIERSLLPKPIILPPPPKVDKQVDATVRKVNRGVLVKPAYVEISTQIIPPTMVETGIECQPETSSVEVDATPRYATAEITAIPEVFEQGVNAMPDTDDRGIDVMEIESELSESSGEDPVISQFSMPPLLSTFTPSLQGIITLPMRAVRVYTYYLTLPVRYMLSFTPLMSAPSPSTYAKIENGSTSSSDSREEKISEKSISHVSSFTSSHENHVVPFQNASTDVNPVRL